MLSPTWSEHEPGALVRRFTPERLESLIENTRFEIKRALRRSDMDMAWVLVGKLTGLKWCLAHPL